MWNMACPFPHDTGWRIEDNLAGAAIGDVFVDGNNRKFRLWRLGSVLASDTTADGQVAVVGASSVVFNISASGINTTSPIAAGVHTGAIGKSAGTTTATYRCVLVLCEGVHTNVLTDGTLTAGGLTAVLSGASPASATLYSTGKYTGLTASVAADELELLIHSVFALSLAANVSTVGNCLVNVRF